MEKPSPASCLVVLLLMRAAGGVIRLLASFIDNHRYMVSRSCSHSASLLHGWRSYFEGSVSQNMSLIA